MCVFEGETLKKRRQKGFIFNYEINITSRKIQNSEYIFITNTRMWSSVPKHVI